MIKTQTISNYFDSFSDFKIPILSVKKSQSGRLINTNDEFKKIFENIINYKEEDILFKYLKGNNKNFNINGCCYNIDKITDSDTTTYFITPNNNLSNYTLPWIKHELFNILNPIMGFSDYLLESEDINPNELELIERIHLNAKKMFDTIGQANLFQIIVNKTETIEADEYSVYDFILELSDSLLIKNNIDKPCSIKIQEDTNVSAYIANPNLRTILENHIVNLLTFQAQKNADFSIFKRDAFVYIEIDLGANLLPSNYLNDIKKTETAYKDCKKIKKLDGLGLNYILLLLILDNLNSQISTFVNKEDILQIRLTIPITTQLKKTSNYKNIHSENNDTLSIHYKNVPPGLHDELNILFNNLGNINLLDSWEEMAQEFEYTNAKHKNTVVEITINNIRKAINAFDIIELKEIHAKLSLVFIKKLQQ